MQLLVVQHLSQTTSSKWGSEAPALMGSGIVESSRLCLKFQTPERAPFPQLAYI